MKRIFQSLSIFLICLLVFPLYPIKAELQPRLIVSQEILNFNRITKADIPTLTFTIRNNEEGSIKGTLTPSKKWILLSQTSFDNHSTDFSVTIDPAWFSFQPGLYREKIEIESNGGNQTIPVRLDLVEKKVNIKIFVGQHVVLIDNQEYPIEEPAFIKDEWPWIPLQLVVEIIGGTIDYEKDSANRIVAVNVHYKDINQKLLVCESILVRKNQAFVYWGNVWSVFRCKISYELSQNMVEIEY